ncbi:MAG: lectin like domain-containing protein, partial [Raoultibacter sp.]
MHKNTFISRLVACSFAVVLACGMVPTVALAQPEGESALTPLVSVEEQMARISGHTGQGIIPSAIDPSYYNYPEGYAGITPQAVLPEKFDLRDAEGRSCVTPVKLQNPWGSCWAFSATAAVESNILKQGVGTAATTDFSERHLAWFYNHPLPLTAQNSQAGEGSYSIVPGGDVIVGAPSSAAASLLSAGFGVESEKAVPYQNDEAIPDESGLHYAKSGTWAVGEDKRFDSLHQLKESSMLPGTARITVTDGKPSYTYNPAATVAMKNAIMKTGAISTSYAADVSKPGETGDATFMNYTNWAQYTNTPMPANHGVSIVGWNDDYKVSNFNADKQPPEPGAWIVKNSWGAGEPNVFPNKRAWGIGGTGYFYLSYYDQSVMESATFDLATSDVDTYGITHQYDYLAKASMIDGTFTDSKGAGSANVFTAQSDQTLKAASVSTPVAGTKATISVYKLNVGATSPLDGELLGITEAAFDFAGYHRVPLARAKTTYDIRAGEKFSVVAQITAGDTYYSAFERGISEEGAKKNGLPVACKAVINPGESYLLEGGVWKDAAVALADPTLTENGDFPYGNAMIKAFADKAELPPVSEITVATVEGSDVTTIPVQTVQKTEVVGNLFVGANPSIVLSDLAVGSPVPA